MSIERDVRKLDALVAALPADRAAALRSAIDQLAALVESLAPAFPAGEPVMAAVGEAMKDLALSAALALVRGPEVLRRKVLAALQDAPALRALARDLLAKVSG